MMKPHIFNLFYGLFVLMFSGCQPPESVSPSSETVSNQPVEFKDQSSVRFHFHVNQNIDLGLLVQYFSFDRFYPLNLWYPEQSTSGVYVMQLNPPYSLGLYRLLNTENNEPVTDWLVSGKDQDIHIYLNDFSGESFQVKIVPEVESNCLQKIIAAFSSLSKDIESLKQKLKSVSVVDTQYYTKKNQLREQLEYRKLEFYHQIDSLQLPCKATYAYEIIAKQLRKPSRYEIKDGTTRYETEPSLLYRTYWNYTGYFHRPMAGHPVFYQQLNEFLKEYAGETSSEIQISLADFFSRFRDDALKTQVTEWLIYYFLDRDQEDLAKWISENYQDGCNDDAFQKMKKSGRYDSGPPLYSKIPPLTLKNSLSNYPWDLYTSLSQSDLTVLYFWKYDCTHCLSEINHLKNLRTQYSESELQIVGIHASDNLKAFHQYLVDHPVDWKMFHPESDDEWTQIESFVVRKTPKIFVVTPQKKIISNELQGIALKQLIRSYFQQNP